MSNAGHLSPGSLRPGYTLLPDGRGRMVTTRKLSSGWKLDQNLNRPWGALYSEVESVDCTGRLAYLAKLKLVDGQSAQQTPGGGDWVWVRIYEDLTAAGEELRPGPPLGVKFAPGIQTNGQTDFVITRNYGVSAAAAPSFLVKLIPPAIFDPLFTTAPIVDQGVEPDGAVGAVVWRKFAHVPTEYSDPDDQVITLPGVAKGAFAFSDDFPFRTQPENAAIPVVIDRKFFLSNRDRIPVVPRFKPVDADGNRTDVLTDTTTPTADEYMAYVAGGTYLVDRCTIHRWMGDIWERRTVKFRAQ